MATHVLSADTLISSLMPSSGGSLASGDTIELAGHDLIVDVDAVDYPVTLSNGGAVARMEGRDRARIKLNATLPATICPWIDPAHPLPVSDPDHAIDADAFRTPLTANARFEIQLSGNFGLGGGTASLPTATREGNFWAKVAASPSSTSIMFDRDFPLHAGDWIVNYYSTSSPKYQVLHYDTATRTATLSAALSRRTVGDVFALLAGGVLINKMSTSRSDATWISSDARGGTLVLFSAFTGAGNGNIFGKSAVFARVLWGAAGSLLSSNPNGAICASNLNSMIFGQLSCGQLIDRNLVVEPDLQIGELVCLLIKSYVNPPSHVRHLRVGSGIWVSEYTPWSAQRFCGFGSMSFANAELVISPIVTNWMRVVLRDCRAAGAFIPGEVAILEKGTVSRTARTDFPTDTDLPDAFYHAPNAADAATWRYEDRWVRKGETLRMRARWMPAGASSKASVAVTELATWWPDLWQLGADALAKAEFAAGLEQLRWHDGAVEWRNDTGKDCQVRVWECVSGDTLGGYLRVWEATGGAM